MPIQYRVVECRPGAGDQEETRVSASTPEAAAFLVLREVLFRSGSAKNLRARVYSQRDDGPPTMVRLYAREPRIDD